MRLSHVLQYSHPHSGLPIKRPIYRPWHYPHQDPYDDHSGFLGTGMTSSS